MSETGLVQILEGALLAAGRPMTVAQLAELFEENERPENTAIKEALQQVAERCEDRGFELQQVASGYRFQVRQNLSPWVGRLWQERPPRYSRALLETLALIAYRQPITRGEIEEIRGVAVSSNIIKTLHERDWIRVVGHRDVPGRPAMYATTKQFLDYFNLKSLDQLPTLAEIRDLETLNAELGFAAPASEEGDDPKDAGPELTVVGGTDHIPDAQAGSEAETETETEDDAATETSLNDAAAQASSTGLSLEEAARDLESRASAPIQDDDLEPPQEEECALAEGAGAVRLADASDSADAGLEDLESVKPESQG